MRSALLCPRRSLVALPWASCTATISSAISDACVSENPSATRYASTNIALSASETGSSSSESELPLSSAADAARRPQANLHEHVLDRAHALLRQHRAVPGVPEVRNEALDRRNRARASSRDERTTGARERERERARCRKMTMNATGANDIERPTRARGFKLPCDGPSQDRRECSAAPRLVPGELPGPNSISVAR